jgi:hypothetical protein
LISTFSWKFNQRVDTIRSIDTRAVRGKFMDVVVLQTRLAEAEAAYHKLMTGQAAVEFRDSNGEQVKYNQSSIRGLTAYIADLKRQLGLGSVTAPMRAWF